MRLRLVFLALFLVRCSCGPDVIIGGSDGGRDAGHTDSGSGGSGGPDAGLPDCVPPDVLIALDRTLTMHRTAQGATPPDTDAGRPTSKWWMAIDGIERLTASPFDEGIRFGLELWPRARPECVSLSQRLQGTQATNTACEGPEVLIPPGLRTGAQIAAALDPETTPICFSTPTGAALIGANDYLRANRLDGGQQFIVLVTDGADWDVSCPNPNPLAVVDAIRDGGVSTLVVGFSAEASLVNGVGAAFLDDLACAGGTAKGFPGTCYVNDAGFYRARNAGDAGLFFVATDATELSNALREFGKTICCGCIN